MSRTIPLAALALFMALALTGSQAQCPVPAPASEPASALADSGNEKPPLDVGGAVNLSGLRALALYESLAYGFNISYPEEWTAQEPDPNQEGIVAGFLAPGEDMNSPEIYVFVQVESLPAGQKVSLDQYTQALMQILKKDAPQIRILADEGVALGSLPGHAIAYNIDSDGRSFRVLKAWAVADGRAYIFTYNAPDDRYEEFSADVSGMLKSFQVT